MNIKKLIFEYRLNKAIKKANCLKKETAYRYMVLLVKGRPRVFAKKQLKHLIKTRYFKKGIKISTLEKTALYITN